MKKINFVILITCVIFLSQMACTNNKEDLLTVNSTLCDTVNTKYASVIAPILNTHCNSPIGCHGGSSANAFSLETYSQVKASYFNILVSIKSYHLIEVAFFDCLKLIKKNCRMWRL